MYFGNTSSHAGVGQADLIVGLRPARRYANYTLTHITSYTDSDRYTCMQLWDITWYQYNSGWQTSCSLFFYNISLFSKNESEALQYIQVQNNTLLADGLIVAFWEFSLRVIYRGIIVLLIRDWLLNTVHKSLGFMKFTRIAGLCLLKIIINDHCW